MLGSGHRVTVKGGFTHTLRNFAVAGKEGALACSPGDAEVMKLGAAEGHR